MSRNAVVRLMLAACLAVAAGVAARAEDYPSRPIMLVVPYPPGFLVLVPGQVVSKQILYFLAQLDVKEIHGYNPDLGLSVFTEDALKRINAARCSDTVGIPDGRNGSR